LKILRWLVGQWNKLEARFAPKPEPDRLGQHQHRWRYIVRDGESFATVRQCTIRECGAVEISGDVPEGLGLYMDLMTTPGARLSPIRQAEMYQEIAPEAVGDPCPKCGRLLPERPAGQDLIKCPYCGVEALYRCPK
jgi:hypothetical protein